MGLRYPYEWSSQLPTVWKPMFSRCSYNRTLLEQNFRDWLAYVLHVLLMEVGRIKKGAQQDIAKTSELMKTLTINSVFN